MQERFLQDGNDRMKLLLLLCAEEDDKLQMAAAGALAMLTAAHKKLCTKITLVVSTLMLGLFSTSFSYSAFIFYLVTNVFLTHEISGLPRILAYF